MFISPRFRAVLIAFSAIILVLFLTWILFATGDPSWTNEHPGDGLAISLASGNLPDGRKFLAAGGYYHTPDSDHDLRITSLNAENGKALWEVRYDTALPNMNKQPRLAIDSSVNVLVGWDYWALPYGRSPIVQKLDGTTGRSLWEYSGEASPGREGLTAVPVPGPRDRVWVSSVRFTDGAFRRFLTLLRGADGTFLWEKNLMPVVDNNTSTSSVYPLKGGDAIVISPPQGGHGIVHPQWVFQRISGTDGSVAWEVRTQKIIPSDSLYILYLIDEKAGQLIATWYSVLKGSASVELISFDLENGVERWRSPENLTKLLPDGARHLSLDDADDIVVWGRQPDENSLFSALLDLTLGRGSPSHHLSVCLVLKSKNGVLRKITAPAGRDERIEDYLTRPNSNQVEAILLDAGESWRIQRVNADGQPSLGFFKPPGTEGGLDREANSILTTDGKIVLETRPNDVRIWKLSVW